MSSPRAADRHLREAVEAAGRRPTGRAPAASRRGWHRPVARRRRREAVRSDGSGLRSHMFSPASCRRCRRGRCRSGGDRRGGRIGVGRAEGVLAGPGQGEVALLSGRDRRAGRGRCGCRDRIGLLAPGLGASWGLDALPAPAGLRLPVSRSVPTPGPVPPRRRSEGAERQGSCSIHVDLLQPLVSSAVVAATMSRA